MPSGPPRRWCSGCGGHWPGMTDHGGRLALRRNVEAVADLCPCPALRLRPSVPPCSASPKPKPPRSAPPMSRTVSSRLRSNRAGCSPASPTTPRHGRAPGPSPAGRRCRPRCPRCRGGPANGDPDPSPPRCTRAAAHLKQQRRAAGRGGRVSIGFMTLATISGRGQERPWEGQEASPPAGPVEEGRIRPGTVRGPLRRPVSAVPGSRHSSPPVVLGLKHREGPRAPIIVR